MSIKKHNVLYHLSRIRRNAFALLERGMKEVGVHDLPPSYGDILHLLLTKGPLQPGDIARCTGKDKSTISAALKSLEGSGYVSRGRKQGDGRKVLIHPTRRCKKLSEDVSALSTRLEETLFQGMGDEETTTLLMLLDKVAANIEGRKKAMGG
ncbi:MarR family transcriptional regulator [Desulfoluna limicola]|uniref:MarR family transcriptional regulator n=1 Tax=Desulfoluna limicola TaxID=2810562 RepID=A0ABM7PL37_9BACT|nr:MarR family transcriptional regulator [Desulfoluna limicola]BCS98267.1 MarR family transcriptional regulator [Desulfoluna limicola]